MCLSEVRKGEEVNVLEILDEMIRIQLIRFGIGEGTRLKCMEKIPFGPFMLRYNRQEIAIGREVARKIRVTGGTLS